MDLSQSYIAYLLLREAAGQLSFDESADLERWKLASGAADEELKALNSFPFLQRQIKEYEEAYRRGEQVDFPDTLLAPPLREEWSSDRQPGAEEQLIASEPFTVPRAHRVHFLRRAWFRIAAAAAILLFIATGSWYMLNNKKQSSSYPVAKIQDPNFKNDVLPGSDGAVFSRCRCSLLDSDF